jgi:hypothetical protein
MVAEPAATPEAAVTSSAPDALPSRRALREANLESEAAQPVTAEPLPAVPVAAEPVTPQPVTPEPVTPEPVSPEPVSPASTATAPAIPVQEPHQPTQALRPEDFELAADQNRWNQPLSTGAAPAWNLPEAETPATALPETAPPQTAVPQTAWPETSQPQSAVPETAAAAAVPPEIVVSAPVAQPVAGAQPDTGSTTTDDWGLRPTGAAGDAAPRPTTANTPWAWLIAVSPLIAAAILIYALANGTPSFSNVLFLVGFIAPYLLVVVFAVADRSRLVILGHADAPSWTWAALTAPVYLVVRGGAIRRELGSSGPWLYVWLACFVVGVAAFALYGLLAGHALVPGLPEGKLF